VKILLLHPEDSPRRSPWTGCQWDLVVDLGKSAASTATAWQSELRCPILRLESFRQGSEDLAAVRETLQMGRARLLDREGLDWWELTAILMHPELETVFLIRRLARELDGAHEFWGSRNGWPIDAIAVILGRKVQSFDDTAGSRARRRLNRYRGVLRNLSISQLSEIFLDKYDARYRWRKIFAWRKPPICSPVVLLPTAYTNVSRMAAAYASMLPEQQFLLVATRNSGLLFEAPPNVHVAPLASYAEATESHEECADVLENWQALQRDMRHIPEVDLLHRVGRLNRFPHLFRQGLATRNAWRTVLESEQVCAVLCGDDSNPFTRLPVLLAKKRGLPTLDFHHGALDGRFLIKDLPSDLYLAKSQMERDYLQRVCGVEPERVILGAPTPIVPVTSYPAASQARSRIVFFSEPYESSGGRGEEIYRELLPSLARLAAENGRQLIIKLHPFESVRQRSRLIERVLSNEPHQSMEICSGPLSRDLLLQTWFGITIESSTVLDCALQGIPCFLCEWLVLNPYGYVQQYGRFGVGYTLNAPAQISAIPRVLAMLENTLQSQKNIWELLEPHALRGYLAGTSNAVAGHKIVVPEACA
jgi:hypothetical protein